MSVASDLVQDSRLDTTIRQDGITVHVYLEAEGSARRVRRKEYWERERRIGRGGFGQVHLQKCIAGRSEGRLRAVKILDKPQRSTIQKDLHAELEALAKFSRERYSTWFIQSFGWYEDIESVFITMEYCQHGDLQTYLADGNCLSPDDSRQLAFQMIEALLQMHRNDFVHRDVKPGNILVKSKPPDEWWIVLADFGISKRIKESHGPSTIKGTYGFMAPELMGIIKATKLDGAHFDYKACDMWAAGEVIVYMLTGKPRFKSIAQLQRYCTNMMSDPWQDLDLEARGICRSLINRLMAISPGNRITAAQAIEHDWFLPLQETKAVDTIQLPFRSHQDNTSSEIDVASNAWTTTRDVQTARTLRPTYSSRVAESVSAKPTKDESTLSIVQQAPISSVSRMMTEQQFLSGHDAFRSTDREIEEANEVGTELHVLGALAKPWRSGLSPAVRTLVKSTAWIGWIGTKPAPSWFVNQVYSVPIVHVPSHSKAWKEAYTRYSLFHPIPVRHLRIAPNQQFAALLDETAGTIHLFRLRPTLALLEIINGLSIWPWTSAIEISNDSRKLAVYNGSSSIIVWDISAMTEGRWQQTKSLFILKVLHKSPFLFSPDSRIIAAVEPSQETGITLKAWSTKTGDLVQTSATVFFVDKRNSRISNLRFSDDSSQISLTIGDQAYAWNLQSNEIVVDKQIIQSVCNLTEALGLFCPDGIMSFGSIRCSVGPSLTTECRLRSKNPAKVVTVWRYPPATHEPWTLIKAFGCAPHDDLKWSKDSNWLAVSSKDEEYHKTKLVDVTKGTVRILQLPNAPFTSGQRPRTHSRRRERRGTIFSPDDTLLALHTFSTEIHIFDCASGVCFQTCRVLKAAPNLVVAFSPDNSTLLAVVGDNLICAWDIGERPTQVRGQESCPALAMADLSSHDDALQAGPAAHSK